MTPHEYATAIVVPTVREFLMERGDLRRAFLACVATYHLVDYLAHAHAASNSSKAASEKAKNEAAHEIRSAVRAVCALSFDVVQGICNGTKHADLIPTREAPILDSTCRGAVWGQGRWGMPGLEVEQDGQKFFVDWCVQPVVLTFVRSSGRS